MGRKEKARGDGKLKPNEVLQTQRALAKERLAIQEEARWVRDEAGQLVKERKALQAREKAHVV